MYHIKEGKRTKQSAELIVNGLISCMREKNFNDITITDIQKASGVGRATFYRLFDNLGDVLAYHCDQCFERMLHTEAIHDYNTAFFDFWMEESDFLTVLIAARRDDILYSCSLKYQESAKIKLLGKPEEVTSYHMAIIHGILIGTLCNWVSTGKHETSDELSNIIRSCYRDLAINFL